MLISAKNFRDASRAASRKNIKLLVVETFSEGHGMWGEYARLALCFGASDPASDPILSALNLRRVNDEKTWRDLLRCSSLLLESHAPNGPEKRIFDAIDALIISYFDGRHWKSRAWIDMMIQIDDSDAKRVEELLPEQRATLELMQSIKSRFKDANFPGDYDLFLQDFYENPDGRNRR